jgi:hypothetical protein
VNPLVLGSNPSGPTTSPFSPPIQLRPERIDENTKTLVITGFIGSSVGRCPSISAPVAAKTVHCEPGVSGGRFGAIYQDGPTDTPAMSLNDASVKAAKPFEKS